jgi:hypothetical protein
MIRYDIMMMAIPIPIIVVIIDSLIIDQNRFTIQIQIKKELIHYTTLLHT